MRRHPASTFHGFYEPLPNSAARADKCVGAYAVAGTPVKVAIAGDGAMLYFQPTGQAAVPLEATTENTFKIDPLLVFEIDVTKREMTVTRAGSQR